MSKSKATEVLRESTREDAVFDLLLLMREDLMTGEWRGHLGQGNHREISGDRRKSASKTSYLDMRREDFRHQELLLGIVH